MWMVNMRNREYRRHARQREIARVDNWLRQNRWYTAESDIERAARQRAVHPQSCSSYCCGNPRKWFGEPTMQEQRARFVSEYFDAGEDGLISSKDE
jgi:hypothetical protein